MSDKPFWYWVVLRPIYTADRHGKHRVVFPRGDWVVQKVLDGKLCFSDQKDIRIIKKTYLSDEESFTIVEGAGGHHYAIPMSCLSHEPFQHCPEQDKLWIVEDPHQT